MNFEITESLLERLPSSSFLQEDVKLLINIARAADGIFDIMNPEKFDKLRAALKAYSDSQIKKYQALDRLK